MDIRCSYLTVIASYKLAILTLGGCGGVGSRSASRPTLPPTPARLPHKSIVFIVAVLLLQYSVSLFAHESDSADAVTFFAIVDPASFQMQFTATIGNSQVAPEVLADAIRPGSGRVLRITSVQGALFASPGPPPASGYALFFVGACTPRLATRGFGNGSISVSGAATLQISYRPGLVAKLLENETLCFRSLIQSNQQATIEVHGFLAEE